VPYVFAAPVASSRTDGKLTVDSRISCILWPIHLARNYFIYVTIDNVNLLTLVCVSMSYVWLHLMGLVDIINKNRFCGRHWSQVVIWSMMSLLDNPQQLIKCADLRNLICLKVFLSLNDK